MQIGANVPLELVNGLISIIDPDRYITVVLRGAGADLYCGPVSTPHRILYAGLAGQHDNDYADIDPFVERRLSQSGNFHDHFNDNLEDGDIEKMRSRTRMFNGGENRTGV